MELYYQDTSSSSQSTKEKRPALKRGQLKRQIARTITNLVVRSGGGGPSQAAGRKFRREPSHN
ncbi:hypothetical protein ACP70R_039796 [Stipagrostis hirtigluma subsp. patula]